MTNDIYHDDIYRPAGPDEFKVMLAAERYMRRSDAFDDLISKTHDHFWDPLDHRYVDYCEPFDLDTQTVLPFDLFPEFKIAAVQALSQDKKIKLVNENARWMVSGLLHGEQGALSLCSQLCNLLVDPGAQEYASNQAREEARHVTAFGRYVEVRWGKPHEVGESLGTLLGELVQAKQVYKKLIGMQILVEGLAMGLFAVIYAKTNDPLLKRITQLVMTDETFHHRFGKTWAEKTIPHVSVEEHELVEDWAAYCFEKLLLNLVNIDQRKHIFAEFGLDWEEIKAGCEAYYGADARKSQLQQQGNIFRVLARTLIKSGIVTDRTMPVYSRLLNVDEATNEDDPLDVIGEVISNQGIAYLRKINETRRSSMLPE